MSRDPVRQADRLQGKLADICDAIGLSPGGGADGYIVPAVQELVSDRDDLREQVRGYRHGVGIAVSSLTALYLNEEQPLHLRLHAVTLIQEIRQAVGRDVGRPDWESDFLHSAAATVIVEQEFPGHVTTSKAGERDA